MDNDDFVCGMAIVGAVVCICIGLLIGILLTNSGWEGRMVEDGYAQMVEIEKVEHFQMIPITELNPKAPTPPTPPLPIGKWYYIVQNDSPVKQMEVSEKIKDRANSMTPDTKVYTEDEGWGNAELLPLAGSG